MDDTNNQYQALKKNIKDFIRTQNTDKKKKWSYLLICSKFCKEKCEVNFAKKRIYEKDSNSKKVRSS